MNKVAVIGLGTFGREVAIQLARRRFQVLAIDQNEDVIESIKNDVHQAIAMNATDEKALIEAKVNDIPIVVNAIGSRHSEDSILITALLKQLRIPKIIARATSILHERILYQIGADSVINPEQAMGEKIAYQIAHPGFKEIIPLADSQHCIAEIPVPTTWINRNLIELNVRTKNNINVVGIRRLKPGFRKTGSAENINTHYAFTNTKNEANTDREAMEIDSKIIASRFLSQPREVIFNIDPVNNYFQQDDILILLGTDEDINKLSVLG